MALLAVIACSLLASCAYSVKGPDDPEMFPAVAADPNLVITGLEIFLQDVQPETTACGIVNVRLDYGAEVTRRTQIAWRDFREKYGATHGSIAFDSLDIRMECRVFGSLLYPQSECRTRMALTATFAHDETAPVSESIARSVTSPSSDCNGTKKSMQGAISYVLGDMLLKIFNFYGVAP